MRREAGIGNGGMQGIGVIHFICNLNLNLVARLKSPPWNLSSEINENAEAPPPPAAEVAKAEAAKSAAINIQIQGWQTQIRPHTRNGAPSSLFQTNCKDPLSKPKGKTGLLKEKAAGKGTFTLCQKAMKMTNLEFN